MDVLDQIKHGLVASAGGSGLAVPATVERTAPARSLVAAGAVVPDEYLSHVVDVGSTPVFVPSTRIQAALASKAYTFALSREWASFAADWDQVVEFLSQIPKGSLTFEAEQGSRASALVELGAEGADGLIVVELEIGWDGPRWTCTVAAHDRKGATKAYDAVRKFLPDPPPPPPPEPRPFNEVRIEFWMQGPMGTAASRSRWITTHSYKPLQQNYSTTLRADDPKTLRPGLDSLMAMEEGPEGGAGKLVLFHGPPGTGKTRAILSLISEWRDWCASSVVTDADKFFGDATYLNSIIFEAEGMGKQWLMLVIEDGDEFLNVESKDSKGQSIARLLNLADGIVGQGLNLITLLSTNVDVASLNPAVVRDGRALTNLHFDKLSVEDATAWAVAHDLDLDEEHEIKEPMALAELYGLLKRQGKDAGEFAYANEPEGDEPEVPDQIDEVAEDS